MADQYYIEQGYYTPDGYFVYVADAQLTASSSGTLTALGGIQRNAISSLSATASISCDATRLGAPTEASASLSASAQISTTVVKTVDVSSTQSVEFTFTSSAGRILEAQGSFTGAFAPTLSVEVIRNHTAILDANFTVTTVGVANRSTSITVDTIAALNAQAAKTVDVQSTQTSTATISTQAVTTKSATSTLTSTATVTCDALNVQFASASMAVGSVLYSRVFKRYDVPWQIELTSGLPSIDTSIKKWGDGSLTSTSGTSYIRYYPSDDWPGDLVLEFWHYRSTSTAGIQINLYRLSDSAIQWNLSTGANRVGINYASGTSPTVTTFNTATNTLSTGWQHIVYVYDATQAESAIFIDGIRRYFRQDPVMAVRSGRKYFEVLIPNNDYKIDELRILKVAPNSVGFDQRSTTCTVPTGPYRNTSTTRFLAHYDTDFAADFTELELGQASLSSTITLSATGQETAAGSATLTSQSTISVIGSLLNVAQASITSTASLSATIGTSESGEAAITASADLTATASKTTDINSSQNAEANTSTTITRQREFAVSLTGAFTPTLSIDVLRNHTAILDAVFTVSAQISAVQSAQASITASTNVSTDITVARTFNIDAAATVTQSASADRIRTTSTNWLSEFQFTAQAGQEQEASASITATTALTVNTDRIRGLASTQFSVASLQLTEANVYRNLGDQTLTAQASLSADVFRIKPFASAISSTATVSIQSVKTTDSESNISAEIALATQPVKTASAQTNFASIATQLSVAYINATGTITLGSTSSLSVIIGSIKPIEIQRPIQGIRFDVEPLNSNLNDHFLQLYKSDPLTNFDRTTANFLVSFWAYSPDGTVLDHFSNSIYDQGSIRVYPDRVEFRDVATNHTFSGGSWTPTFGVTDGYQIQWTGLNTENWNHYIIYRGGSQQKIKLYINGQDQGDPQVGEAHAGYLGLLSPMPDGTSNRRLQWSIGANPVWWNESINELNKAARSVSITEGAVSQFVSWFQTNVPNATSSLVRDKLYADGYIDLGYQGTATGLNRPRIFFNLQEYTDSQNRGNLELDYGQWREITQVDYNPDWDNINWTLTTDYELSASDQVNPGFFIQSSLTVSILGVFLNTATLSATTTLACSAVKTVRALSTQTAQAQLAVTPNIQTGIISSQSAEFSLLADVNLGPAGGAALFDHSATLTAQVGYLRDQSSTQSVSASFTADVMVIPPISGDALLTVFASQTTQAGFLISAQLAKSSAFTITVEGTVIDPVRASGTLQVDTALVCEITRVRPGISLEMSAASMTADATVIPPIRAEATLATAFTLTANISGVYDSITLTASLGTMSIAPVKTARPTTSLTGIFTAETIAGSRIGIVALLQAQGFQLTAGDIINIDPYLTLRILPELRLISIEPETRTITITAESRTLLIEGYSQ